MPNSTKFILIMRVLYRCDVYVGSESGPLADTKFQYEKCRAVKLIAAKKRHYESIEEDKYMELLQVKSFIYGYLSQVEARLAKLAGEPIYNLLMLGSSPTANRSVIARGSGSLNSCQTFIHISSLLWRHGIWQVKYGLGLLSINRPRLSIQSSRSCFTLHYGHCCTQLAMGIVILLYAKSAKAPLMAAAQKVLNLGCTRSLENFASLPNTNCVLYTQHGNISPTTWRILSVRSIELTTCDENCSGFLGNFCETARTTKGEGRDGEDIR